MVWHIGSVVDCNKALGSYRQQKQALEDINAYLRTVEEQLAVLPENSASQALRQLADYTVRRVG